MSRERIAGIMMGISVGVAIGYYLKPHKEVILEESHAPAEPNPNSGSAGPEPLYKAAAASGAGQVGVRPT
jgi:hypothetical protein